MSGPGSLRSWLGQIGYGKGLDVALAAVAEARQDLPGLRLIIAGVPAGTTRRGSGMARNPSPAEVTEIYGRADLLIFPTRYEAFPLVVIEAMAAGLPVIVSDRVPSGIVTDGRNGVVITGHDPSQYAAALRLLADPQTRAIDVQSQPEKMSASSTSSRRPQITRRSLILRGYPVDFRTNGDTMRKQARELSPVACHPVGVLGTTGKPRVGDQGCAPNEVRIRYGLFRVRKVAVVDCADFQPFDRLPGDQVVDMTADAERGENNAGSAGHDNIPDSGTYLTRQSGVAGCDPAPTCLEAERGVGGPSALCSVVPRPVRRPDGTEHLAVRDGPIPPSCLPGPQCLPLVAPQKELRHRSRPGHATAAEPPSPTLAAGLPL